MKRFLWLLIFIPFIIAAKISDYTEDTSPTSDDYILTVDQTSGSNKKVQLGNIPSSSGFTDDGTTVHNTTITDNVGIGTTTASSKLTVAGTITVSGSVQATSFVGDGSGLTGVSAGWTDGGTNVYTSTTTDNVGIGTTTPSTTLEIVKQGSQSPLMISSTATGDGDYLIVTSSGSVGVGTTSSSVKMTVNRPDMVDFSGPIFVTQYETTGTNSISFNQGQYAYSNGTVANNFGFLNRFALEDASGALVDAWRDGYQWTDATVKNSERRGIITVAGSPTTKWIQTSDGEMGFNTAVSTSVVTAIVDIWGSGSSTGKAFQVRNSGSSVNLTIQDNGNVGIGTATPGAALVVQTGSVGIGTTNPEGKFVVRTTSDIGWVTKTGANTACNTTCVSGCVFGIDTAAVGNLLLCTDATADSCLCAGSD